MSVKRWFKGKQKHILIWAVLLIYLFSANQLYIHFFLKNGKPLSTRVTLPAPSKDLVYKLADMQVVQVDGEDLNEIKGYAFFPDEPELDTNISIVLSSPTQQYVFPTNSVAYPNMIESYPNYTPGMSGDEFSMLISKNVIKPGRYKIGILVEEQDGNRRSYVLTGSIIQKTPNTIQYMAGP